MSEKLINNLDKKQFLAKVEPLREVLAIVAGQEAVDGITGEYLIALLAEIHSCKLDIKNSTTKIEKLENDFKKRFFLRKPFPTLNRQLSCMGSSLMFVFVFVPYLLGYTDNDLKEVVGGNNYFKMTSALILGSAATTFLITLLSNPQKEWLILEVEQKIYLENLLQDRQKKIIKALDQANISKEDIDSFCEDAYALKNNRS